MVQNLCLALNKWVKNDTQKARASYPNRQLYKMNRFVVFIIICLFLTTGSWLADDFVGITSHCINSNCNVAASTSLESITLALFVLLFTIYYPQQNNHIKAFINFSTTHKVVSFLLDLSVIMLVTTPFIGLPLLISESTHTGGFLWTIQRNHTRSTDPVYILLGFVLLAVVMYYYYRRHKKSNKPTIGQYVLSNIK